MTAGQVTIQTVNTKTSRQADVGFLDVLKKMGCIVTENSKELTVHGPKELQGLNVDMRDFSDTFVTLAVIAPFAKTPTTITNIRHARHKESDRMTVVRENLEKLKIKVEEGPDWLKIYPGTPEAATIDSHNDRRIAIAFSVMGLRVVGIKIKGAECVSKTCPDFFKLWESLYD